jgi:hypothetical protein
VDSSIRRSRLVDTLLNALEAERYMRGALLLTIIDELGQDAELVGAAQAARLLMIDIDALPEDALAERVDGIRQLIRSSPTSAHACA